MKHSLANATILSLNSAVEDFQAEEFITRK